MIKLWSGPYSLKAVTGATLLLLMAKPAAAAEWDWILTPYIWASDTSAELSVNQLEAEVGIDFEDLIDKVDMGAQVHFEGKRERLGFFTDLTYLAIDESQSQQTNLPSGNKLRIDSSMETVLGELGASYQLAGDSLMNGVDVLIGARVIDMEMDVDIRLPGPLQTKLAIDASETLVDAFVGVRGISSFGPERRWSFIARADIGTGDTEQTLNFQANLMYRFGQEQQYGAVVGYRYLDIEYDTSQAGNDINADFTMSGPNVGFAFRF